MAGYALLVGVNAGDVATSGANINLENMLKILAPQKFNCETVVLPKNQSEAKRKLPQFCCSNFAGV